MIELHLIGYTADLGRLVLDLAGADGGRYRLVVDEDLFATIDELREARRGAGLPVGDLVEFADELGLDVGHLATIEDAEVRAATAAGHVSAGSAAGAEALRSGLVPDVHEDADEPPAPVAPDPAPRAVEPEVAEAAEAPADPDDDAPAGGWRPTPLPARGAPTPPRGDDTAAVRVVGRSLDRAGPVSAPDPDTRWADEDADGLVARLLEERAAAPAADPPVTEPSDVTDPADEVTPTTPTPAPEPSHAPEPADEAERVAPDGAPEPSHAPEPADEVASPTPTPAPEPSDVTEPAVGDAPEAPSAATEPSDVTEPAGGGRGVDAPIDAPNPAPIPAPAPAPIAVPPRPDAATRQPPRPLPDEAPRRPRTPARPSTEPAAEPAEQPAASLSPAEIQTRLRMGRSVRAVAREAGVDEDRIRRWEAPILAEQARIRDAALGARLRRPRLGASALPLGEAVARNLGARGVEPGDATWEVARRRDGRWRVGVRWTSRGRKRSATWTWDPEEEVLAAASDSARELGFSRARR